MSSVWQPQAQGLEQILQCLRNANSPDNAVQMQVQQSLREFNQIPDYNNYLMYILTAPATADGEAVRAMAGLLLKNNIRLNMIQGSLDFIKERALVGISDPLPLVRGTVGIIITTILSKVGLPGWPEIVGHLAQILDQSEFNALEGSLGALEKIVEDSGRQLDPQLQSFLIPRLMKHSDSEWPKIRVHSLKCLNLLVSHQSPVLFANLEAFIQVLSRRANDQISDVRRYVCQAFVHLLEERAEVLLPQLPSIIPFMVFATQDQEESVALEACEFWLAFSEKDEIQEELRPYLASILPVLMKATVYSESDISILDTEEQDSSVPDRAEDIKPRHRKTKTHSVEHDEEGEVSAGEESDEEDLDGEDDEVYSEWNLRKCAAATIDMLSNTFGEDILEFLLPPLNEHLFHKEWMFRESGVLVLGAIAEGCRAGIEPHLHQLIPYLFQCLKDPKSLVRSITCWTLGRYCRWCLFPTDHADSRRYFEPLVMGLLEMIMNRNKRVQEAACGAFSTVEEVARDSMVPYLAHILHVLTTAFGFYQKKNLLVLYDTIGTLAESVGPLLNQKQLVDILMPPLIAEWNQLPDDDAGLFPLLECLTAIACALGMGFQPFAQGVYERCMRLVQKTVTEVAAYEANPRAHEQPERDFLIVGLDLLSGVIQGLKAAAEPLIVSSQPSIFDLLMYCVKDPYPEVRQSALALVGDLAIGCFPQLKPFLPQLLPIIIENIEADMEHELMSVCNNACWSLGEIALHYQQDMAQYVPAILERIIPLINQREIPRTLRENISITLGRLGLVLPQMIAPHMEHFAEQWCKTLRHARDNAEKESAFQGFCAMVLTNPNGLMKSFALFCDAVAQWREPSPQLMETFHRVLHGYKQMMGAQWASYYANFPENLRQKLQVYQL